MVASLAEARRLFILSTAPGLIDMDGTGEIVPVVDTVTPEIEAMAKGTNSPTAVGGMIPKLQAAKLATTAGCETIIADGAEENAITRLMDGEPLGTRFKASDAPIVSKKRWLAYFQRPSGSIQIDEGARIALIRDERSLLAAGIAKCEGDFHAGDVIDVFDSNGYAIARGESAFSSHEIRQISGKSASEIEVLFPDKKRFEVIHRDALVLL